MPSYSERSVAALVINFLLNFSTGLIQEQRRLWNGDRSNFVRGLPSTQHVELEGSIYSYDVNSIISGLDD